MDLSLEDHGQLFHEAGVWNYSTMLLREELGLLLLGARDTIYALDLDNISDKKASVRIPLCRLHNGSGPTALRQNTQPDS